MDAVTHRADGAAAAGARRGQEWDLDRAVEATAAAAGLTTLGIAAAVDRRLLVLPAIVSGAVLLHGLQRRSPLQATARRLGIRTQDEIDGERYRAVSERDLVRQDDCLVAGDRVRARSSPPVNRRLDTEARDRVAALAGADRGTLTDRIAALTREWDIERYLQTNAAIASLAGVVLGATTDWRFLLLPAVVFGFLLQHAVQGWCPPLPVFRRLGVRTRNEIDRERYAVKALRDG